MGWRVVVSTDASAKELARSAQTTAETITTDNNGSYLSVTPATINSYEPSIPTASGNNNAYLSSAAGTATTFTVVATSTNGDAFTIVNSGGVVTRTCTPVKVNGGCSTGNW